MVTVLHVSTPRLRRSIVGRIEINVYAESLRGMYRGLRASGASTYVARKATIGSAACWPGTTIAYVEQVPA